jgi:hypothetical protein
MQSSGEQDVASPSGAIMDVAYRADDERILSPFEFATARVRPLSIEQHDRGARSRPFAKERLRRSYRLRPNELGTLENVHPVLQELLKPQQFQLPRVKAIIGQGHRVTVESPRAPVVTASPHRAN